MKDSDASRAYCGRGRGGRTLRAIAPLSLASESRIVNPTTLQPLQPECWAVRGRRAARVTVAVRVTRLVLIAWPFMALVAASAMESLITHHDDQAQLEL